MGIWAGIKYALNSTLGTSGFKSLDKLILLYLYPELSSNIVEYAEPGNYKIVVPPNVTQIKVTACGGGGGGQYGRGQASSAGGGGGAAIKDTIYTVTPLQLLEITVGERGTAGNFENTEPIAATNGGTTVISNIVTLPGGMAPLDTSDGERRKGGKAGGAGGGDGGNQGSDGKAGLSAGGKTGTDYYDKGGGGGGSLGIGGNARGASPSFTDGEKGGGGAGGGGGSSSNNRSNGTNGGSGYVKIEFIGW